MYDVGTRSFVLNLMDCDEQEMRGRRSRVGITFCRAEGDEEDRGRMGGRVVIIAPSSLIW